MIYKVLLSFSLVLTGCSTIGGLFGDDDEGKSPESAEEENKEKQTANKSEDDDGSWTDYLWPFGDDEDEKVESKEATAEAEDEGSWTDYLWPFGDDEDEKKATQTKSGSPKNTASNEEKPKENDDDDDDDGNVYGLSEKQMELKLAKLWARMDEVETNVLRQKERMRLLEKGIMLGVIPDELLSSDKDKAPAYTKMKELESIKKKESPKQQVKKEPSPTTQKASGNYKQHLIEAQSLFNRGKYGQAITKFESIGHPEPLAGGVPIESATSSQR